MQRTATDRLEIQIQRLRLPVDGLSLKHHQAVGLHIVLQSHLAVRRQRQRRTQGAGQALYPGTVVEPYLQPHGGHTGRRLRLGNDRCGAPTQTPEQPCYATHRCRLAWSL
ncbi:hypothetical protein D3C79_695260 [compost metagenome]